MPEVVLLRCGEHPKQCSAMGARFQLNNSQDAIHPYTSVRQKIRYSDTCAFSSQALDCHSPRQSSNMMHSKGARAAFDRMCILHE